MVKCTGKKIHKIKIKGKEFICTPRHSAVYGIDDKRLYHAPVDKDGTVDMDNWTDVIEAPKKFKSGHIKALKMLGTKKPKRLTKFVEYH